jgi:DNA-binding MarR family transcriptional regulator
MKAQPMPGPRYEALLQLLRTSETLWQASRTFFDQWQLSSSQFNILNLLRGQPEGVPQIELSRLLITHRSNVTGLVDRLEKRGLVVRNENPRDRRVYWIALTPAGRQLLEEILPDYHRLAEKIWGDFPVHQAQQLGTALCRIGENAGRLADEIAAPVA